METICAVSLGLEDHIPTTWKALSDYSHHVQCSSPSTLAPPEPSPGSGPPENDSRPPIETPQSPSSPDSNAGASATTDPSKDAVAHHDDEPATPHPLDGISPSLARTVVNMQEYYASELGYLATQLEDVTARLAQTQRENGELRRRLDVHLVVLQGAAEFMQRVKEGRYRDLVPDEVPDKVPEGDPGIELGLVRAFGGEYVEEEKEIVSRGRRSREANKNRVRRGNPKTRPTLKLPTHTIDPLFTQAYSVPTEKRDPVRPEPDFSLPPTPLLDSHPIRSTGLRAPRGVKRTGLSSFARRRIKRRSKRLPQTFDSKESDMNDSPSELDQAPSDKEVYSSRTPPRSIHASAPASASASWRDAESKDKNNSKNSGNGDNSSSRSTRSTRSNTRIKRYPSQAHQPKVIRRSSGWTAVNVPPVRAQEEEEEEKGEDENVGDLEFDNDVGSNYQPHHDTPSADNEEEGNTPSRPLSPCIDSLPDPDHLLPLTSSRPPHTSHSPHASFSPTPPTTHHHHCHHHHHNNNHPHKPQPIQRPRYSTPRHTTTPRYASGTSPRPFRFHRMDRTVLDVWQEYKHGTHGNPAIESLEVRYGTGWRTGNLREIKYASNYVGVRQKVVSKVEEICEREGWSPEEACRRRDERVDGRMQMLIAAVRKGEDPFMVIPKR